MSNRLHSTHSNLLKLWFHFVIFGLTMYSCTTRVKDNRHHVSDIVVGAALGAGLGIATAMGHCKEVAQSKSISSKGNIGYDQNIAYTQLMDNLGLLRKPKYLKLRIKILEKKYKNYVFLINETLIEI